ncbi:DUF5819 family protein [Lysinibacter sp. HNR]|uniref:DUF5819 family protein n=1 Tax=Lysinibacter sp. HNR TaxID=3031408 RepID=UPI0024355A6A|nr:DUF5819 family protein [Lysinibacter sp. HNR]WGD37150.1 DUF5819 family protein [Lysinibacter sp. HNR]
MCPRVTRQDRISTRNNSALPGIWSRLLVVGATGLLLFHFGIIFLHIAPSNPVSQQFSVTISLWTTPFFTQNWAFFAPEPVSYDTGILVRGSFDGESVDEYLDITSPGLERRLHNLLPDNLSFMVSRAGSKLFAARSTLLEDKAVRGVRPDAQEQEFFLEKETLDAAPQGLQENYRRALEMVVASAMALMMSSYGALPDAVKIRVVHHEFPRWSERVSAGLGKTSYSESPWLDLAGNEVVP